MHRIKSFGWSGPGLVLACWLGVTPASRAVEHAHVDALRREAERFPRVEFGLSDDGEARQHVVPPPDKPLRIGDMDFHAVRFRTPDWLNGPVDWMMLCLGEANVASGEFKAAVLPMEGGLMTGVSYMNVAKKDFPRLYERYPEITAALRQVVERRKLGKDKEYLLYYRAPAGKLPQVAVMMTVGSERGLYEFGWLPRGPKPIARIVPAEYIMCEVMEIRERDGDEAALRHLDRQLHRRAYYSYYYSNLFTEAWREGQVHSGRDDRAWAATLYDRLLMSAVRNRYYRQAIEVVPNTLSSLRAAHRHGRHADLLAWWGEAQTQGGYLMDPGAYPDLGPGIALLPEVRLRDIPRLAAFAKTDFGDNKPRSVPFKFERLSASGFRGWADQDERSGRWREALEWRLWLAKWAETECARWMDIEIANTWHGSSLAIAECLRKLGFDEASRTAYSGIVESTLPDGYQNRSKTQAESERISIEIDLGTAAADASVRADELAEHLRVSRYASLASHYNAVIVLAKALIHEGRVQEGMERLDELVEKGYRPARLERVKQWIRHGIGKDIEAELQTCLSELRESGDKISEPEVYSLYADFLETAGRHAEAVRMRREAVRLCRGFDLFVHLPRELAKLAVLLDRLGDSSGADDAAKQAKRLADTRRLPARAIDEIHRTLALRVRQSAAADDTAASVPPVDLQPVRSLVIPVEGVSLETRLTLSNPSQHVASGVLAVSGLPVSLHHEDAQGVVLASIGENPSPASLPLRIDPGHFVMIRLLGDKHPVPTGEAAFTWQPESTGENAASSSIVIEAADEGVTTAVIEAGEFRRNPFYGVPIHHHYIDATGAAESAPVRFVTSVPARVEIYDGDDHPLAVDADGNGSLNDAADERFAMGDGNGHIVLALADRQAVIRLQVYPAEALPEDGLTIRFEVLAGGEWIVHAENRLMP